MTGSSKGNERTVIEADPDGTQVDWEAAAWTEFEKDKKMRMAAFNYTFANFITPHRAEKNAAGETVVKKKHKRTWSKASHRAKAAHVLSYISVAMFNWTLGRSTVTRPCWRA